VFNLKQKNFDIRSIDQAWKTVRDNLLGKVAIKIVPLGILATVTKPDHLSREHSQLSPGERGKLNRDV
jgi:hypothetical protein